MISTEFVQVKIGVDCFDCGQWITTVSLPSEALSSMEAFVHATAPVEGGIKTGHLVSHHIRNDYYHDMVTTWPVIPSQLRQLYQAEQ
jgi:hypothetical protein